MPLRPFGFAVDQAARQHALAAYPEEACGLVVNGAYVPLRNVSATPRETFEIAPEEMLREGIQAIVHSHPDQEAHPSADDMAQQIASGLPWGLLATNGSEATPIWWWGPGIPTPPLLGREFRHGPSGSDGKGDCYALVKDFFLTERGVELPEVPRGWNWWENGFDLYRDGFKGAGFRQIPIEQLRPGDCVMLHVLSPVPNHAGVVRDGGLLLHHLTNRLSRLEPLTRWMSYVTHAVRHQSAE